MILKVLIYIFACDLNLAKPNFAFFDSIDEKFKSLDATSGNFVFYVAEAYLIDNGKITRPVKGATLAGNSPKSLMQIKALGNSMVLDPGYCEKNGQIAYVTDGQPTILIENMTVGGNEL
ncbi:MAG: metallopeptidase TldD-related protein [Synergistaceae bacterium]|nr:metallopeptidase TldD-related protein [Synergistaceae bacterium]